MIGLAKETPTSAFFITFSGNCKKALSLYQQCFGGELRLEPFEKPLHGFSEHPIVLGSLVSKAIRIYGTDLVHDEGRTVGNYLAIYWHCKNTADRTLLIEKLSCKRNNDISKKHGKQKLIEITDVFNVRWVLGI